MNSPTSNKRVAFVVNALSGRELQAGKSDSARVYGVLVDPALGACDPACATLVQDCEDRDKFSKNLLAILKEWRTEDQLIIYFSGHGTDRFGLLQLCFGIEKNSFYPFKNILTELTSYGVKKAIIILDTCQSGLAGRKSTEVFSQNSVSANNEITAGLVIVTSCRETEFSYENEAKNQSVFTELFCEAITTGLGGTPTQQEKISVSDLVGWINGNLTKNPKYSSFSQTSTYSIDGAEHSVWIAKNLTKFQKAYAEKNSIHTAHQENHINPKDFDGWLTKVTNFSLNAIRSYRDKLRPDIKDTLLPDALDEWSFLTKSNLASNQMLFASGVVLFSDHPETLLPRSYVQCFEFPGVALGPSLTQKEFYGPLIQQIEGAMAFIESRIGKIENREPGDLAAKFIYQYPMICLREMLANAFCHRDYLHNTGHVHVRIFENRIEITSPGKWGTTAIEHDDQLDLSALASQSATKNERLATALRRIRFVETAGTGIPSALRDCTECGARIPFVRRDGETVTVEIYPRTNWQKIKTANSEIAQEPETAGFLPPKSRFRIALSFADEERNFVGKVAHILADFFGHERILYDKFHEAEFARVDLGVYLPKLFVEMSDLLVVIISDDYDQKKWTGLEWPWIYATLKDRGFTKVMLCRFGHTSVSGLHGINGFIELDDKTPDEFVALILERLALNEGLPKDHYTTRVVVDGFIPNTENHHNLPRLQPFFGRQSELQKIAVALDPDSRTWGALIDGPGGMGKTSLAVRAAYDTPPDVFDRIVFISLKSRELQDDGLRDLSGFLVSGLVELFGELARELGRDDIVKVAEDQRPRLLLDALRGTRTLLVLDNLESLLKPERDTLFTFVKKLPAGCKAILTSRGRIGSGAEELILEKLDEQAALDTLAELATHNPHLAKTSETERLVLYRETGGKPLLLRWTAGQIGRGHCLSFTDALDFLRSCPEGNDPLEFIFGDLVEDFSDAETRVLCALTYFTLPAKVEHVAANAGLREAETDRALRSLVNRSLVVPNDELTAFTLVPMVADFLRKKKPEVVAETGNRLEQRAYALIIENGFENHARFLVLEAAWPGIAPALALFLAGDNHRLQTVCVALASFLEFQGRWDEWLALSEKAEARAVAAADHDSAGWRAYHAGSIHSLRQQAEAVLACADRASAYWARGKADARKLAFTLRLHGLGHRWKGDFPAAITANHEALALFRSLDATSEDVAIVLNDLADAEHGSGNYAAAETHYREALHIARALGYAVGVAYITGNLAALALDLKDWSVAETLAREALPLSEGIHRQELIATGNHSLAIALVRQGKAAEALPHARRAVNIYTRLGSPNLAVAQATLAECGG